MKEFKPIWAGKWGRQINRESSAMFPDKRLNKYKHDKRKRWTRNCVLYQMRPVSIRSICKWKPRRNRVSI